MYHSSDLIRISAQLDAARRSVEIWLAANRPTGFEELVTAAGTGPYRNPKRLQNRRDEFNRLVEATNVLVALLSDEQPTEPTDERISHATTRWENSFAAWTANRRRQPSEGNPEWPGVDDNVHHAFYANDEIPVLNRLVQEVRAAAKDQSRNATNKPAFRSAHSVDRHIPFSRL